MPHRFVHYRFALLHRVLMNGRNFRFRLIKYRLHLCFLRRREIQLLSDSLERLVSSAAVPLLTISVLILGESRAAERKCAHRCECD